MSLAELNNTNEILDYIDTENSDSSIGKQLGKNLNRSLRLFW